MEILNLDSRLEMGLLLWGKQSFPLGELSRYPGPVGT